MLKEIICIMQEFEKAKALSPMTEVFIWSLDADLNQYRTQ